MGTRVGRSLRLATIARSSGRFRVARQGRRVGGLGSGRLRARAGEGRKGAPQPILELRAGVGGRRGTGAAHSRLQVNLALGRRHLV